MARIEQDDFSSVSWHSDRAAAEAQSPGAASGDFDPQESAGPQSADATHPDAAALGGEVLECTVSQPLKENEGSKDVFVSYLISTYVSAPEEDASGCFPNQLPNDASSSPPSQPSKSPRAPSAGGSQTLSSYTSS